MPDTEGFSPQRITTLACQFGEINFSTQKIQESIKKNAAKGSLDGKWPLHFGCLQVTESHQGSELQKSNKPMSLSLVAQGLSVIYSVQPHGNDVIFLNSIPVQLY